jgi:hypothetical protein
LLNLFTLARAQQPVVDKEAGQLIAYSLMHEGCGNRRIHAARERTNHAVFANLLTNLRNLFLNNIVG